VKATNGRLYVSDGINTDIFTLNSATPLKATTSSFGTTTFLPLSGDIVFAAGNDRRLRALDWTTLTTPVELFANDISPTGGTINRIGALQLAGGRVYVAAGDAGLLTYDVNAFTAPFPIRNYSTGATTSAAWVDGKLYVSRAAGGISEFTKSASSGSLTAARQWDARVHTLYEGSNGFLLTSSGSTLFYWTLNSSTPVLVTSSVTPAAVVSAVLIGSKAYAILANGTFVSADMGQLNPPPQTIALANRKPSFIAHSGNAVAISSVGDATTTIDWYSSPDFSAEPSTVVIEGTSSSGLALTGGTAAVFNFRGINLISFPSRTTSVIAKSNTAAVQRIAAVNGSIFTLTDEALMVWDIATQKLTRSLTLPVFGNALAVDTIAAVPTSAGVIGVAYATPSSVPTLLATRGGNAYYKKALASGDRLYLYDGRAVDIFETRFGFAPDLITSVRPAGIVDFAITSTALFTLTSGGVTTAYSRDGNAVAQGALSEGIDVQSLAINTAGNAVWVSIARGCFTGACEKKTIVLDPKSLVRTATLDGAAIETATTSDRVFAIFDLPAEIRSYSLADPLHPSVIASIAAEGSKTPVSIAVNESVNVAGDKFYVYNLNLTKTGEWYESYQGDPTNTLQYVDQRARADGGCVLLSGRTFAPQFAPSGSTLSVPAVVKSIAVVPGRYYVLTDYSLEVWTTQQPVPMPRRRASR
jgi:hypothetical protein